MDKRSFAGQSKRSPSKLSRQRSNTNSIGNAKRSYERYMVLARAAELAGDRTEIESLYQHAEHYFRLMREQAN